MAFLRDTTVGCMVTMRSPLEEEKEECERNGEDGPDPP